MNLYNIIYCIYNKQLYRYTLWQYTTNILDNYTVDDVTHCVLYRVINILFE